jgi:DNA-binding winged helix-turn-helix (wHTH) protein/tetratricopeptide (TPR) repeat protein
VGQLQKVLNVLSFLRQLFLSTVTNKPVLPVYEFGPFRLEATERLLLRGGRSIPLKPKVFDLLVLFVKNSGHVLGKDELMEEIWPNTFVEEHNLAVGISLLRNALDDNLRKRTYIETVTKRGYRFLATVTQVAGATLEMRNSQAGPDAPDLGEIRSIAVLPFKNIRSHSLNGYLGLGLADALITKLSGLKDVTVRPTSAVMGLDRKHPLSAGRKLKVNTILDGSIQKCGGQIRVTAQHVRVSDGSILWAAKFDEEFTNLFAVEDSISEQVASALEATLTNQQKGPLSKRHTQHPGAYQAYLKGRYFFNRRSREAFDKSIKYFNLAIENDPNYALAYAGLAACYNIYAVYSTSLDPREAARRAKAAALKALKLDDRLAEARIVLGHIRMRCEWDWAGAEEEFKLALEVNPNCASAHQLYGLYLRTVGRLDESMTAIKLALELDPLSLAINASLGALLYLGRRFDEAVEQLRSTIEMDVDFAPAHFFLGLTYEQKGLFDQAIAEYQKIMELYGDLDEATAYLGCAHAKSGRSHKAKEMLNRLQHAARRRHVSPYLFAVVHIALGDHDKAFALLEKACEEQDEELALLKMDPLVDRLRDDTRFEALLKRIGLT